MYYIFYPQQDATIYERNSSLNSGLDQILEVSVNDSYVNRSLIQFNTNLINEYIIDNNVSNYSATLNMFTVDSRNIPLDFDLEFYPISGSWNNGTGKQQHEPQTTDGVSWSKRLPSTTWKLTNLNSNFTGSYNINSGGGNWNSSYKLTQGFNYNTSDVKLNINTFLDLWLNSSSIVPNNGILIKLPDSIEKQIDINTYINFFSNETNTIFQPRIIFGYNDSIYVSGSTRMIPNYNEMSLTPKIHQTYKPSNKVRIDILARERFPIPKFTTTSSYLINYRLPETSYYSLVDDMSETTIIDYADYTKISHLSGSNFININTSSLLKKRRYRLKFKIVTDDGNDYYFDYKYPFFIQ